MKRYLILGLLMAASAKLMLAQDPHFSQIQYNPLYLNPAFAGVTEYGKANNSRINTTLSHAFLWI